MHNGLTNEITFTHNKKKFILSPLSHSQVVKDQVQKKQKRDEEKKLEKQKTLWEQKAWEKSVPSHKVIQQDEKFENTFENMLLVEQPPSLIFCKGTLTCTATNLENLVLPPQVKGLLKEFDVIFSKEGPIGLPPF